MILISSRIPNVCSIYVYSHNNLHTSHITRAGRVPGWLYGCTVQPAQEQAAAHRQPGQEDDHRCGMVSRVQICIICCCCLSYIEEVEVDFDLS